MMREHLVRMFHAPHEIADRPVRRLAVGFTVAMALKTG